LAGSGDWGGELAKILIVEDNALNIKLFCDLLAAHGHEPQAVTDSRLALDAARQFHPDLVITDIQLPHVSGLELIRLLRADGELKGTPIMAVTAYAAQGDEERIRSAGAQSYVSKPISVLKFVAAVQELLIPIGEETSEDIEIIDDTAEVDDAESLANEGNEGPGPVETGGEEEST
jgi:two-component system cell cycle response regulator DivK